jgi:hypothetical protein
MTKAERERRFMLFRFTPACVLNLRPGDRCTANDLPEDVEALEVWTDEETGIGYAILAHESFAPIPLGAERPLWHGHGPVFDRG